MPIPILTDILDLVKEQIEESLPFSSKFPDQKDMDDITEALSAITDLLPPSSPSESSDDPEWFLPVVIVGTFLGTSSLFVGGWLAMKYMKKPQPVTKTRITKDRHGRKVATEMRVRKK
jgi:hypothetical protein